MPCPSFLNMCYSEIWILYSSTIMHVFVSPVKNFCKNIKLPLNIYLCLLPSSLITCSKRASIGMILLLQERSTGNLGGGSQFPSTSTVFVVYRTQCNNMTELLTLVHSSMAMRPEPVWVAKLGFHCTQCMIRQNTHNMQNKHMETAPCSTENKVHRGH